MGFLKEILTGMGLLTWVGMILIGLTFGIIALLPFIAVIIPILIGLAIGTLFALIVGLIVTLIWAIGNKFLKLSN